MYLSRIELAEAAGLRPEFWKSIVSLDDVHRIVWSWFADDPDRHRDFLYRQEGAGRSVRFYTLSPRPPVDPGGFWRIETKEFAPKLATGDCLAFSLRANPTLRKASGPGEGKRHDVVMDAKFAARSGGGDPQPLAEVVQTKCTGWLLSRAESCGFELADGDVRADGYRPVRFYRRRGEGEASVTTVDFDGRLTVRDPSRFVDSLTRGIGPAKAFGCGLMLIRRV